MIARLRGQLAAIGEDHVILDVQGVGYLVFCGVRTLHTLPPAGSEVTLQVETVVRAESIALYGFAQPVERSWFRLLQTVQGVGARVALAVLSVLSPAELAEAVVRQDKAAIGRATGVGQRLASRIASELKDRLGELAIDLPTAPATGAPQDDAERDAASALANLGYGRAETQAALAKVRKELGGDASVDALLRASLRELARP